VAQDLTDARSALPSSWSPTHGAAGTHSPAANRSVGTRRTTSLTGRAGCHGAARGWSRIPGDIRRQAGRRQGMQPTPRPPRPITATGPGGAPFARITTSPRRQSASLSFRRATSTERSSGRTTNVTMAKSCSCRCGPIALVQTTAAHPRRTATSQPASRQPRPEAPPRPPPSEVKPCRYKNSAATAVRRPGPWPHRR
jgi:hypothetical protein